MSSKATEQMSVLICFEETDPARRYIYVPTAELMRDSKPLPLRGRRGNEERKEQQNHRNTIVVSDDNPQLEASLLMRAVLMNYDKLFGSEGGE